MIDLRMLPRGIRSGALFEIKFTEYEYRNTKRANGGTLYISPHLRPHGFDLHNSLSNQSKERKMVEMISGQVPSKSNSYKIVLVPGPSGMHRSLAKTSALNSYEKSFYLQCSHYRNKNIKGFFELHLNVYNSSQRPDLDNSLKIVLDCLQNCKAIQNDRQCVKIVVEKFVDKTNPRIEFELIEI